MKRATQNFHFIKQFEERAKMALHFKDITEQIIGAAFEIHNQLGYGFLENV